MSGPKKEFMERVCGWSGVMSDELESNIATIAIRKDGTGTKEWGFTMRADFANSMLDFIETNHPQPLTENFTDFVHQWRSIPMNRNARIGMDVSRTLNGANTVWFGGSMPPDVNWFIWDYDLSEWLPTNNDIIVAASGGIKLGFDLNLDRFVGIKLYGHFGGYTAANTDYSSDEVDYTQPEPNHTFRIEEDNSLTLLTKQFCVMSANNVNDRWASDIDTINEIKDKYHGSNNVLIFTKTTERVTDMDGNWGMDQGAYYFTYYKRRLSWEEEPSEPNDDINNPWRASNVEAPIDTANT